jgi:DNA-3-methyladenine glycosylase
VEAYAVGDPASHGFKGLTPTRASMFGPPGRAYVYRSYGVHWCLNFVCGEEGSPQAVLIRALQPLAGIESMAARRGLDDPRLLCAGPGRLCQALGVTREHDGVRLDRPPFELLGRDGDVDLLTGPRIGLSVAVEEPWRYVLAGSRYLSRPAPRQSA